MFALIVGLVLSSQPAQDPAALVKEGQKLMQAGKIDAAEPLFRKAIALDGKSYDGHYALGRLLDLKGNYAEARDHFGHALATATEDQKLQIWMQTGVSWAFEGKPDEAATWLQRRFDAEMTAKTLDAAAATANALARIYLEAGQPEKAEQWYRTGYETARQIEKLPADQRDLWDFRWHHAQARIAARRERHDEARAHAAAARSILDKGTNPDQAAQMPYLTGYLKFYAKDYRGAIADLTKSDQTDPFILGLIASAYEQQGNAGMARAYYAKVLESPAHTINAAYSRPVAQKALALR
ncbi:MAG TPA: tetratricopeptide repeat protein [Vicinamibacterales bacterium]|jgi:tetratricopeptide (TPR) repeat protein